MNVSWLPDFPKPGEGSPGILNSYVYIFNGSSIFRSIGDVPCAQLFCLFWYVQHPALMISAKQPSRHALFFTPTHSFPQPFSFFPRDLSLAGSQSSLLFRTSTCLSSFGNCGLVVILHLFLVNVWWYCGRSQPRVTCAQGKSQVVYRLDSFGVHFLSLLWCGCYPA
jgi:hypothetical protein